LHRPRRALATRLRRSTELRAHVHALVPRYRRALAERCLFDRPSLVAHAYRQLAAGRARRGLSRPSHILRDEVQDFAQVRRGLFFWCVCVCLHVLKGVVWVGLGWVSGWVGGHCVHACVLSRALACPHTTISQASPAPDRRPPYHPPPPAPTPPPKGELLLDLRLLPPAPRAGALRLFYCGDTAQARPRNKKGGRGAGIPPIDAPLTAVQGVAARRVPTRGTLRRPAAFRAGAASCLPRPLPLGPPALPMQSLHPAPTPTLPRPRQAITAGVGFRFADVEVMLREEAAAMAAAAGAGAAVGPGGAAAAATNAAAARDACRALEPSVHSLLVNFRAHAGAGKGAEGGSRGAAGFGGPWFS
jgi:hypothetical protein